MKLFSGIFLCLVLAASPVYSALGGDVLSRKKVLIVHSYHEGYTGHVDKMNEGIQEALKACNPVMAYFYMDTVRCKTEEWKKASGQIAEKLMHGFKPDLIITMDDNAQGYFANKLAGKKGAPTVVFGGVNADPAVYGFPAENVTGVLERPNIEESIQLAKKIVPGIKRMLFLSDKSKTADLFHTYSRQVPLSVEVVAHAQPETFQEWKEMVDQYKDRVDAYGLYVIRAVRRSKHDTSLVPAIELVDYIHSTTGKPAVGFIDASARTGMFCGISVSMHEQGYAAGRMACDILGGMQPSEFKAKPTTRGRILLNLRTAEMLKLPIPYHIIRNAEEVVR